MRITKGDNCQNKETGSADYTICLNRMAGSLLLYLNNEKMTPMLFSFSDEKVEELRKLVEEEHGETVTYEEAQVIANNLLRLYELLSLTGQQA